MKGKQNRGSEIQVDYIGNTDDLESAGQSGDSARGQSSQSQSGRQSGGERAQGQRIQESPAYNDRARYESQSQDQSEDVPVVSTEDQGTRSYE